MIPAGAAVLRFRRRKRDDIVIANRTEIAVGRLGRMKEPGRRAGARESCGNLSADDARLAHAGDDDAAPALEQELDSAFEMPVDAIDEPEDGGRLAAEAAGRGRVLTRSRWSFVIGPARRTLRLQRCHA